MFQCPYCKSEQIDESSECTECKAHFPWIRGLDELRQQMKERETSRLRATTTLIHEAIEASRGGPPITLSAIKGFAASWLFPRTFIVLGSLAGALLLGLQTWVIWGQTRLLTQQAEAAREEQAVRLRERLSTLNALKATGFKAQSYYRNEEAVADLPWECDESPCQISVHRALFTNSTESLSARRYLFKELQNGPSGFIFEGELGGASGLPATETTINEASIRKFKSEFLDPAIILCSAEPTDSDLFFSSALKLSMLYSALAKADSMDITEVTFAFSQMAMAADTRPRTNDPYQRDYFSPDFLKRFKVSDAFGDVRKTRASFLSSWKRIETACERTAKDTSAKLKKVEGFLP